MANDVSTVDALNSLKPNAQWVLRDDVLELKFDKFGISTV